MENDGMDYFKNTFLIQHNELRKKYGALPLIYSEDLERGARLWARNLAKIKSLEHDETLRGVAENIMCIRESDLTPDVAVAFWAEESKLYNFEKADFQPEASHFTQMVWANTRELGVSMAKSKDKKVYIVARYSPPGNYKGLFSQNVRAKGSAVSPRIREPCVPLSKMPDPQMYEKKFVRLHNKMRRHHNAPEIMWDGKLATEADRLVKLLVKSRLNGQTEPEFPSSYGRCVIFSVGGVLAPQDIMYVMYQGSGKYDYEREEFQPECGSFTQVVWKETTHFGAGVTSAKKSFGCVILYSPPGNIKGSYGQNVLMPASKKPFDTICI